MDQDQSPDKRTVVTRGQAKKRKEKEMFNAQCKRLKQSFQTGGQGINNQVDQALGKIKIENVIVKEESNIEESQPDVLMDNAFNDSFLDLDVTNERENSFLEETHEQKVVVVSRQLDTEQDDIINLTEQISYRQQTSSIQAHPNISVNLPSSSSTCGDSAGNLLPNKSLENKVSTSGCVHSDENMPVYLAKLNTIGDVSDAYKLVTVDGMNVHSGVNADHNMGNVVFEDVSPDESAVHCKCPCWKEIIKLKEVIQRMEERIQSFTQPSTTVNEHHRLETSSSHYHSNNSINLASSSTICGDSGENSLPKAEFETLEEKVVFVTSDMDCKQNAVINFYDKILYHPQACVHSSENMLVSLTRSSSISGASDEHELVTNDIPLNVQSAVDRDVDDLLDLEENVVCEDMADVSTDESSVQCKYPFKKAIQRMVEKNQSLAQASTTVKERHTHMESITKGAKLTRRDNLVDQNSEEISIKNVVMVTNEGIIAGSQPVMLSENIAEPNEKIGLNNGEDDSKDNKSIWLPNIHIGHKLLDPDWLKTLRKNSKIDYVVRNKKPCGNLRVMDRGSFQKNPGFPGAMNAVTILLERIGPKIENFMYELNGELICSPVKWYKSILSWIRLMPHLKYLNINCHGKISEAYKQELEKAVCCLEFPKLTRLKTFSILGVSRSVVQSALIPNSKVVKKILTTDLHVDQRIACPCLDDLLVHFVESKINYQNFNNIIAPVQKLSCNFENLGEIRLNVIAQAVEHFRNTLTSLSLHFERSACKHEGLITLCLPNLTYLQISFHTKNGCSSSRFQGWTFEFFLSLVSQLRSLRELTIEGVCIDHFQDKNRQNHKGSLISSLPDKSPWHFWKGEVENQLVHNLWIELPSLHKFEINLASHTYSRWGYSKLFTYLRPT